MENHTISGAGADEDTHYQEFLSHRDEWIHCISTEDEHGLQNQLTWLIYNAAIYEIVMVCRRIAPRSADGKVRLNGMLHSFVDRCFRDSQLSALRRLIDKSPFSGPKGVYSLRSLLEDMKSNCHYLSRRNLFRMQNLDPELEAVRERRRDNVRYLSEAPVTDKR